jgi:hypothetical protein
MDHRKGTEPGSAGVPNRMDRQGGWADLNVFASKRDKAPASH